MEGNFFISYSNFFPSIRVKTIWKFIGLKDTCYKYQNGKWNEYDEKLPSGRHSAASIGLQNALFLSGGLGYGPLKKSTFLVYTNGTIASSKDLPVGLLEHCVSKMQGMVIQDMKVSRSEK